MGNKQRDNATNRGQAHTTEAVVASVLIILTLLFALQTTTVTPFSSTTTDKHLENQERETVGNAIEIAHSNGDLKQTLLNWNGSDTTNEEAGFAGRENPNESSYYTNMDADTAFIDQLSDSIDTTQTAYNIDLVYYNHTNDAEQTQRLLRTGSPSDNVITVRRPILLHDTDTLTTDQSTELEETNNDEFYINDLHSSDSTATYNYVEVEVIVWRR